MGAVRKLRENREPLVEWRAGQISDPVEKLQFLRQEMEPRLAERTTVRRLSFAAIVITSICFLVPAPAVVSDVSPATHRGDPFPERKRARMAETFTNVWLVEESENYEVYSNGLRIDTTHVVQNQHRFYQALDRNNDMSPLPEWKSQPVGIVFHTTESGMAPFAADQNGTLKRLGQSLLNVIRANGSYNFVIDRFGRVFRVVEETTAANHSGNSVWADDSYAYLNLNSSFLAVAFEAQTLPADGGPSISPAQIHAGRILTELLRSKYKISARNCITHAQVSVNPSNMRIGYHTDWARNFPFREMGLPDNYALEVAALSDFGFDYDELFEKQVGPVKWKGLLLAESELEKQANQRGTSVSGYRQVLRERYKRLYSGLKLTGALEEGSGSGRSE